MRSVHLSAAIAEIRALKDDVASGRGMGTWATGPFVPRRESVRALKEALLALEIAAAGLLSVPERPTPVVASGHRGRAAPAPAPVVSTIPAPSPEKA